MPKLICPKLQRVKGVRSGKRYGAKDYSMRIWIDPKKWQPITLPQRCSGCFTSKMWRRSGKIGENAEGIYEYVIKYKGRLSEVKIMKTSL
jgi:HAE1 family hydrophobic/amphiphilic exporter-1